MNVLNMDISEHLYYSFATDFSLYLIPPPVRESDWKALSNVRAEAFDSETAEWDIYDTYYHHLLIINTKTGDIASGVRLTPVTQEAVPRLYTSSLFEYQPAFFSEGIRWMEMGRLFVALPYRNSRVFAHLWQGIQYYFRDQGLDRLIGSVNVWEQLDEPSRRILIETLYQTVRHPDFEKGVRSKYPYDYTRREGIAPPVMDWKTALNRLRLYDKTGLPARISPALKTYLTLGAKALTIGKDPDYDHSPDVLMEINMPVEALHKIIR